MRQKLNLCLLRCRVHTNHIITLVIVHDFIFQLTMIPFTHFEDLLAINMAARASAAHARDSKHQSNHRRAKRAADSQILMWRKNDFKLICWRLNLHKRVRYKSEKAFDLISKWHYTTRPDWLVIMYPSTNLPRCATLFRSQAHAFSLCDYRDVTWACGITGILIVLSAAYFA